MFKKIGLGIVVLLLAAVGFVWVKLLMPFRHQPTKSGRIPQPAIMPCKTTAS